MSTYKEKIFDAITNQELWRDYSPEEIERTKINELKDKEYEANVLKLEAERLKAKNALLDRLGITEEEAKLLLS